MTRARREPIAARCGLAALAAASAGLLAHGTAAQAQQYPVKPVRIVASEAGGGGDVVARILVQGLAPALGQSIVIDNRAGGVIAGDAVARSAPDGHTLLIYGNTLWVLPLMRKQVPYDPQRDFAPITLVTRAPTILVVHPSIPAKSVKELIAFARARPGQLNYASAALGTSNHLAAELFKYKAKVDIVRVSYRGAASAFTSVLSGQTHLMFTLGAGVLPTIQAGKVRALAVTSLQPSPLFPGLPTVASAGFPGFELLSFFGFFAPTGTPPAILARLNQEAVRVLQSAETRERLMATGVEATGSTPEALAAAIQDEVTRMREVITAAGIREE
jgi:tripartite-type tricarboxylate transporter receptor subunit TctC